MDTEGVKEESSSLASIKTSQAVTTRRPTQSPPPHLATPHQHLAVYAGPPSFLQNSINLQRASFFMNDELRQDLIQRNSLAQASVDPSAFPGNLC